MTPTPVRVPQPVIFDFPLLKLLLDVERVTPKPTSPNTLNLSPSAYCAPNEPAPPTARDLDVEDDVVKEEMSVVDDVLEYVNRGAK